MTLYIDTTQNNLVEIGLKDKKKFIAKRKFKSDHTQAERLLPGIAKLLEANKLKLSDLKKIDVANRAGSFTSLRIGVVTANALGYGLGVPAAGERDRIRRVNRGQRRFNLIEPLYSGAPDIIKKKQGLILKIGW